MKDFTMGAFSGGKKILKAPQESEMKTWKSYLTYLLVFIFFGSVGLYAQQPSASLEQVRNGSADTPKDGVFQNGNLGSTQSHFAEGYSVPYRAVLSNLPAGTAVTLYLEFDIKHGGKHALDYLTNYNRLEPHSPKPFSHPAELIDPLSGTSLSSHFSYNSPTDDAEIPQPISSKLVPGFGYQPLDSYNFIPSEGIRMEIWNALFDETGSPDDTDYSPTAINYTTPAGDLNASNSSQGVEVKFVVGGAIGTTQTVVLAWGGHIGNRYDWGFDSNGEPNSAGGISGSPYHMRLIGWNLGNLGQQDRSLKADAVVPAPECTPSGPTTICEGSVNQTYSVAVDNPLPGVTYYYSWSIPSDTNGTGASIVGSNTGMSIQVDPGTGTGDYTVVVNISSAFGSTKCMKTTTVDPAPSAPGTTGDSNCGPGVVSLSASGCTGGTLTWYDAATGGTNVNTGLTYSPNLSTTTDYWVSCTSSDGCEGPRAKVTGTIYNVPLAPGTTGDSNCGPGVVSLSASGCTGGTLTWYDAATGGTNVNTGLTYSPNLSATTDYWVSCTSSDGCEGPRAKVTGTIYNVPLAPGTTGDSNCGPGVVSLSASGCTGGTLTWYDAATGGTNVNTGLTYSPNLSTTTDYWVSCTSSDGCEGPRAKVTGIIYNVPLAPGTTGDSNCGPGVVSLSASGCTGGTLTWYDAATGGTNVNTGLTYSPNLSTTTDYWVSCTSSDGCEGPRAKVTGIIYNVPLAPGTTGDSNCGPGVVSLSASGCTGGTLTWYDAATGGTHVNTGLTYSPNLSTTTDYWVSCTSSDGCEGPRAKVTGIISNVPLAPGTTGDSNCGPGVVSLSASGCTGGTLTWYDAATGGTNVNTGLTYSPNLSTTTDYWVSCTSSDGCEGPRAKVTGIISNVPLAPGTTGDSNCGPGVVSLSASGCTGGTLTWYDAATGGTNVNTGLTYSPNLSTTTDYWVSCTSSDGCEGPRAKVTGTIYNVPLAPGTTGDSNCGPGVVSLSASGCTGGTLTWYDAATGGTNVNTGLTYSPNLSTTTDYWVSCTSSDGCEGPRAKVTGTIYSKPDLQDNSVCVGGTVDMGIGTGIYSSSDSSVATVNSTTGVVTGVSAGSATITYTDGNTCSDTATILVENCAHIFPTQTDCSEYNCIKTQSNSVSYTLSDICLTLQGNGPNAKIKNAVPGVFFYYADVVGKDGSTTVVVDQTSDLNQYFIAQNEQNVRVYSEECGAITATPTIYYNNDGTNKGDVIITFPSVAGVNYIISVKYDVKTILGGKLSGAAHPTASFAMYYDDYSGNYVSGSTGQVNLNSGECNPNPVLDPNTCKSTTLSTSTESIQAESLSVESVETDVAVYPIPFTDVINIDYQFDYSSDVVIEIFDLGGNLLRTLKDSNVSRGSTTSIAVDFSISANQMYMVRVTTERETFVKQIVSSKK